MIGTRELGELWSGSCLTALAQAVAINQVLFKCGLRNHKQDTPWSIHSLARLQLLLACLFPKTTILVLDGYIPEVECTGHTKPVPRLLSTMSLSGQKRAPNLTNKVSVIVFPCQLMSSNCSSFTCCKSCPTNLVWGTCSHELTSNLPYSSSRK